MFFDPRFIFVSIWTLECLGQILFGNVFGKFAVETWVVLALATLSFLLGAQLIQWKLNSGKMADGNAWPGIAIPENVLSPKIKIFCII